MAATTNPGVRLRHILEEIDGVSNFIAGMSYRDMENRGIMLPVSEFSVKYKAPALYDDELTISTHIREIKGPRLVFDYEIHKENGQLVATAQTTLVFVSKENMRPIPAPEEFLELMGAYAI